MHVKNKRETPPFKTDWGETAYELLGNAAGPKGAQHSFALIEIAPGKASKNHYHPIAEESYFIIAGTARIVIDGETRKLSSGDCVVITPKQKHQIFNDGKETLEFIAICVPAWTPDNAVFL